jgi:PAS domain S-box-containing protein
MPMEERSILKKSAKLAQASHPTDMTNYPPVQDQTAQFQKLFDVLPVAVILVDLKGYIQFMNTAAKSLLGEPDELLKLEEWPETFGFYLDDAVTYYPGGKYPLVRALKGETVDESEEMILRKAGDEQGNWISMSTELLRDEHGSIDGAIALIRDITYRKQIEVSREKQIQRIEALYRLSHLIAEAGNSLDEITHLAASFPSEVIGGMSIVTLLNDSKEKIKIVAFHDTNPTGQAFLRKFLLAEAEYGLSEGLAGGVIDSGEPLLIPSISPEKLQAISLPAFKEFIHEAGIGSVLIVPLTGRGGVLGTIHLFRQGDSKPFSTGDQSFLTDMSYRMALAIENCKLFGSLRIEISERLSAQQALHISEERFRSIFETVTLGIKVLDLEGTILQTNSAFQKMIGYTEEEITGRHFHYFLHPDDIGRALELFMDVKNKGVSSLPFEHRTVHKDGSIVWARTFFTVVRKGEEDDAPAFVAGIVENVTEQRRLEVEMAELSNRLRNSMELERLRLAQELHDNPMQALYSASYRIQELRTKADPQLNEALRNVKDTIQNVLEDLRATAKELRPPTIFSFGLENAIRSHVNDVLEKHPNINIHLSLAIDRQTLPEDVRLALFRILQQSLVNVLRHAEATEVHVRFSFDAEEAHLEISDNGKGFNVPPNWMELVRHGHYGLAGAAERVNALGGVLKVESRPGNGTAVRVTIPWKDSAE